MQVLNVLFLFSRLFFIQSQNFRRQVDWCEPSRNEAPTGHNNTILLISLPCARFLPHAGSIQNKRILQVLICKQLTIPIQGCNLKQLYKIASYKPVFFFSSEKTNPSGIRSSGSLSSHSQLFISPVQALTMVTLPPALFHSSVFLLEIDVVLTACFFCGC